MATNDPRVPPEVQEKIRELEQELNEGMCSAFSVRNLYFQLELLNTWEAGAGCVAAVGVLRWRAFFRFQASAVLV